MEKEFKRIINIKAEIFDGSREMMEKYNIYDKSDNYTSKINLKNTNEIDDKDKYYFINTIEGDMFFKKGYYIATGSEGEHWVIEPDIFKINYEISNNESEIKIIKPKISQKIAEIIEEERKKHPTNQNIDITYFVVNCLKSELEYKSIRGDFDIDTYKKKKQEIINEMDTIFEAICHGYVIQNEKTNPL